ncbi:MAG: phage holin family protein [Flavobacteriaceae bacterium]|nr:phage holin family protein [Flavobacteriaceae bacterium]
MRIRNFIIKLFVSTISVMFAVYFLGGVHLVPKDDFVSAVMLASVLGLLNTLLKPLLVLLTLPVTLFSFGLFLLVINAGIIMLADRLLPSFTVDGFWWALAFSFIVSILSSLMENVLRRDKILVTEEPKDNTKDSL